MANTIRYNDVHGKGVPLTRNLFYLTHLRFLVGGLEHQDLFYTLSHLLASFNLERTPVKFNGRISSLDVGSAGSVGNSIFYP